MLYASYGTNNDLLTMKQMRDVRRALRPSHTATELSTCVVHFTRIHCGP